MVATLQPPESRLPPLLDRLRRLDAEEVEGVGKLSPPQIALLAAVAAAPGCGLQALAATLGVSAPTVSVSVARAQAAGLLAREPDPRDGRAIRLSLTEEGIALHQKAQEARRARAARLLAPLSVDERGTLVDLLARALGESTAPEVTPEPATAAHGLAAFLRRVRGAWPRVASR